MKLPQVMKVSWKFLKKNSAEPKPEPEEPKEPTLDEQVQDATKEHVEGTAKVIKNG